MEKFGCLGLLVILLGLLVVWGTILNIPNAGECDDGLWSATFSIFLKIRQTNNELLIKEERKGGNHDGTLLQDGFIVAGGGLVCVPPK